MCFVNFCLQGVHPCDNRRSISDYQFLFPAVDFSLASSWIVNNNWGKN